MSSVAPADAVIAPAKSSDEMSAQNDDFRSLFKTHPSPMWVYEPKTLRFLIVNDAALDLYGYTPDDFARMTVLDIRPDAERARMLKAVETRTDIEKAERWTHLKASGETFEVRTYGREVRFDGKSAILAIVQDRTEVNAVKRQVTDTQSLLDSIVDNLPVGVFVKDMCKRTAAIFSSTRRAAPLSADRRKTYLAPPTARSFRRNRRRFSGSRTLAPLMKTEQLPSKRRFAGSMVSNEF
jgi:PAS domain S-box-containing protein